MKLTQPAFNGAVFYYLIAAGKHPRDAYWLAFGSGAVVGPDLEAVVLAREAVEAAFNAAVDAS